VLAVAQTDGFAAFENETSGLRLRFNAQIFPRTRRFEISHRRAVAPPVAREQLEVTNAFLIAAVEIVGAGNAEFLGTANDGLHQFAFFLDVRRP
jgi:hypothetical protein